MANIKELIQSIESPDSSFDEKLAVINEMQDTLVAMKEHEQEAIDDNVELIIEALRTIEAKVEAKLRIVPEKGEQGIQGQKGEQGDRGLDGAQGKDGKSGVDGKDGIDGKDGVSVQDAKIDFDGSLVITLSDGREINVGEVVPVDVAQTIHKIQSGSGGDSQTTLNAIAALQATIATYGTMATQNANNVAITGGTINNTTVGATTPSTGVFTTLTATGQTKLGGASGSNTVQVDTTTNTGQYTLFTRNNSINEQQIFSAGGSGSNLGFSASGLGDIWFRTNSGGQTQAKIAHTASAVNYVQVTGAATGAIPTISAQGSDANPSLGFTAKGTGSLIFFTNSSAQRQFRVSHTASAVNYLDATGSATTQAPVLSVVGTDTNISLVLQPKGTGALQAQQTDSTATGGNARGGRAVDWQMNRDTAARVASGSFSIVAGGSANSATTTYTAALSGLGNTSSGVANVTAGGILNVGSGVFSAIVGGGYNTSGGWYNFIGGGSTNSGTANAAVTTQSGTMNGTTAVTLSGSNASIKVGQIISGTSIADDTYVAAISGTSLTLSKVASGSSTSTLSFYTPHGVVVGGGNNQATGSYSFIGGGGDAGTAANRNVASGDWSFVGGGQKNTASGVYSSVNGTNNTSSGTASVIAGGGAFSPQGFFGNSASGTSSFIGAGIGNLANSSYSAIVSGTLGTTRGIDANHVFPAINNAYGANATGVAQSALLVLAKQTTDATATVLVSNNSAVGTTNQVILPNNSAYFFTGEIISGVTGGGNSKGWTIEGVIKRGANAASTTLVGSTVTSLYADAGAATWTIAVTADTTNGGLAVTFTGQASTTIRTVCQIRTTEMTY